MRPLLKWLPHLTLDLDYLADYLLVNGSQSELPSERCVYQGIHRLLPGSWLSVTIPDRQKQRRIYWNWLDHLIDPGTDRLEEVSDQYRDRLMQAVRERLRGQTASHLSGGMDSTAIALFALKWISLGMGTAPLHTITLVFERLPTLASETPYIDAALEHAHGILPHQIPADGLLDFDVFTDPPLHDEPYPGLWRLGMDRATIEAVDQLGAATLLTGLGADEILDRQPLHITDLLWQGRFVKAWTEAYQWAHRNRLSLWQVLYPCGLANLFPAWTRLGWGRLFHPHDSLSTDNEWVLPPWILPDFARRYGLRARARENARRTYASCRPTALSFALTSILGRVGNAIAWSLATPRASASRTPSSIHGYCV